MNRLVIIGNGFDIAHGLKTSYMDFINWYWEQKLFALLTEHTPVSKDCLCELRIINTKEYTSWSTFFFLNSVRNPITGEWKYPISEIIDAIKENTSNFSVIFSRFFSTIIKSIEARGWVDIENDYYQLLKDCVDNPQCGYTVAELNDQLSYLQTKLVEYLKTLTTDNYRKDLQDEINDFFKLEDFATERRRKVKDDLRTMPNPVHVMLLSFNYTGTAKKYGDSNSTHNYIHGELDDPEHIIFGYGDELDKNYQDILDRNDNELLKNVKSVKYLETRHYRKLLEFLMSAPFQVLIMGHSCGNSDRTLLNTVFEHENCVSIKPYYHIWDDGRDNYLDIVQNISRNFTNMKLFRDRVVNKEQCKTMWQHLHITAWVRYIYV